MLNLGRLVGMAVLVQVSHHQVERANQLRVFIEHHALALLLTVFLDIAPPFVRLVAVPDADEQVVAEVVGDKAPRILGSLQSEDVCHGYLPFGMDVIVHARLYNKLTLSASPRTKNYQPRFLSCMSKNFLFPKTDLFF